MSRTSARTRPASSFDLACRAACTAFAASAIGALAAGQNVRISVGPGGVEANGHSWRPDISSDGRWVTFTSTATNLVVNDTNGEDDIFLYDRIASSVTRVSVAASGAQADDRSAASKISPDGRYVGFNSRAANLTPASGNGSYQVYVKDLTSGAVSLLSADALGGLGDGDSLMQDFSFDGRFVAVSSRASNLVANDTNAARDVFVYDRQLGSVERVSVDSSGNQASAGSLRAALSHDGRYVCFESSSNDLVANDTNVEMDVFLHDRVSGQTTLESRSSAGVQGNGLSDGPAISGDGRWLSFASYADNLHRGDTNGASEVFVRERATGETTAVSLNQLGATPDAESHLPAINRDGRFVVYNSWASDLAPGDTNLEGDNFLHDRVTGATVRISDGPGGVEGDGLSIWPVIDDAGRWMSYESVATTLVAGDTNHRKDVFLFDAGVACGMPVSYCTAGTTTHGCVPSIGSTGTPSASNGGGFTITVSGLEGHKVCRIFYGLTGPASSPWSGGSSYLCIDPPSQRTPAYDSGGLPNACNGALSFDWNAFIANTPGALGVPFTGGETVCAQAWFRDPWAPGNTNLSDGLRFDVCP